MIVFKDRMSFQYLALPTGYRPDTVGWYEYGRRLSTSDSYLQYSSESTLLLENLSPKDAGRNFTCKGTRNESASRNITILFSGIQNNVE